MLSFGGGQLQSQQAARSAEDEEERQAVRRLQRKGIQVPDFHDARAVGVCLAAIQRRVEEKHAEAAARRQQRAEAAAGFSAASGLGEGPRQPNVGDLAVRVRAYEKEAERLRARLRREEVELEVLEEAAPPPPPGGEEPVQVLARVLARAEEALAARDRLRAHRGEDDEEGMGIGPVSNDPVAEARRFVERKLMGAGEAPVASRSSLASSSSSTTTTRVLTGAPADRRRAMMAARSGRRRFVAAAEEEEDDEGPPEALI